MHDEFMRQALALAEEAQALGEVPVGAVVVLGGRAVGSGSNAPIRSIDPTAHAEIVAIRAACRALSSFQLSGCEIYTTCEPCPMCLPFQTCVLNHICRCALGFKSANEENFRLSRTRQRGHTHREQIMRCNAKDKTHGKKR